MNLENKDYLEKLKYPIGQWKKIVNLTDSDRKNYIQNIANFPKNLQLALSNISKDALSWKYRPEGWTIKQVVHHCADSHINAFIRTKLALTESQPTISTYEEQIWAQLIDSQNDDLSFSIKIIEGIHHKWVQILNNLVENDYQKTYFHPGTKTIYCLNYMIMLYSWHCNHHLAHIAQAFQYKGKFNF